MSILSSNISIKSQVIIFLIAGISLMTLLLGTLTATAINQQSRELMLKNAFQITEGLAKQAIFPILSGSSQNAQEAMKQVAGFQSVVAVRLLLDDKTTFISKGGFPSTTSKGLTNSEVISFDDPAIIKHETPDYWLISAPVRLAVEAKVNDESEFELESENTTEQLLGFAELIYSKENLLLIQSQVVITVISVGVAFIILLSFVLHFGLSKLFTPLDKLANTMQSSEETGEHLLATISGAKEVKRMAIAYNKMMTVLDQQDERLKQHKSQLENEVKLQTKELIDARDAALTASRHKSEFIANMSHELRTPIQSIIGYGELVIEELEVDGNLSLVEDMDKILNNSQRLLQMINSLLDLAKIEAGRIDIDISKISLLELASRLMDTIQPLTQKNKINFTIEQCEAISHIHQDKDKLEQVLINLLSNACKFSPNGSINLSILFDEEASNIIFEVKDSGIGLTPEQQHYIFEEFRQVDSSQTRQFSGTGLGLAICKRFVELMNGQISISSELGKGATFTVSLPVALTPLNITVNSTTS